MTRFRSVFLALVFSFAFLSCESATETPSGLGDVTIGGLLQLTGDFPEFGKIDKAALEVAVEDVNAFLASTGSALHFDLSLRDTKGSPATAAQELRELKDEGVGFVLGITTSAEAGALNPVATEQNMILISNSSTAVTLAVPNDNLFRMLPDDRQQAKALAAIMAADRIGDVVVVHRDDNFAKDLLAALRDALGNKGIRVAHALEYKATADMTEVAAALEQRVSQASVLNDTSLAICAIGFDEVADIMMSTETGTAAKRFPWYGSDGTALSTRFTEANVAPIAESRYFVNPLYAVDQKHADYEQIRAKIKAKCGAEPYANSYSMYDAVWLVAYSYLATSGNADIDVLKKAFVTVASSYLGTSGSTRLNDAGDRAMSDYELWAVRQGAWKAVARYRGAATGDGRIER